MAYRYGVKGISNLNSNEEKHHEGNPYRQCEPASPKKRSFLGFIKYGVFYSSMKPRSKKASHLTNPQATTNFGLTCLVWVVSLSI